MTPRIRRLVWIGLLGILVGQETKVKSGTEIYSRPYDGEAIGQIEPGATVRKLELDRSKKYVKATMEFYIPVEALEDGRVAFPVGTEQLADKVKFTLLSARKQGNRVFIKLEIANSDLTKDFDFSATTMVKLIGSGGVRGELNPFEGKYQNLAIIRPLKKIVAELVFDFKTPPRNLELICKSKLTGEEVYYTLGF
ncbi:MAG: hypothetical protein GXO92_02890 [FCB group bacterium]|nr:hypothetical protein [FCB group bacterium]